MIKTLFRLSICCGLTAKARVFGVTFSSWIYFSLGAKTFFLSKPNKPNGEKKCNPIIFLGLLLLFDVIKDYTHLEL